MGLRRVKEFNKACLRLLAWLAMYASSLWAIWFRERYLRDPLFWNLRNCRGSFCILKKISSHLSFFQKDTKWLIGNGRSISLWFDNWLDSKPIAPRLPFLHFSEKDFVADILVDKARCIPAQLPNKLKQLPSLYKPYYH